MNETRINNSNNFIFFQSFFANFGRTEIGEGFLAQIAAADTELSTLIDSRKPAILAVFDNSIFHGNPLGIHPNRVTWKRCMDMNDRQLRFMVNGLGGMPLMEQYIAYNKVAQMLKDAGIKVFKSYVNEYCTSIDMAGCSVSLLRLDDEMKKYLDYPVEIPYAIF